VRLTQQAAELTLSRRPVLFLLYRLNVVPMMLYCRPLLFLLYRLDIVPMMLYCRPVLFLLYRLQNAADCVR
jgi:hypothetical protein